ncbi:MULTISPECIES: MarR family winged helix-turn-helix transcriptional regulator [Mycobacterium]|uniref:MarR family protein n=2 Tax=Mycobacterium intracellulare TaxID=1767 RepID=X8CS66_MYCIT|nr:MULTISPECIES: MarR family transcriptional regulator [Mycobacterium]EUA58273.1 marR family protein [Mycobacterium intracellulare 1956]EUA26292.1 marR family protein [Mycobacterium intracellulare]MCA2356967.1 MarR family transcriptional regulator [Mycobacterium intracellulare]MCA2365372.1 MarR family transcriptional regulator [Mycobacterium intracellulare]UQB93861.1 MarR family transcriptional regulator [Mycobacterium intracellulare]
MRTNQSPIEAIRRADTVKRAPIAFGMFAMFRAFHGYGAELLLDLGLHPGQELILMQLYDRDGQNQTELQQALGLDHSTISRAIKRMQQSDLVARAASDTDRRAKEVWLTDKGAALRKPLERLWMSLEHCAEEAVPPSRRAEFIKTVNKLEQTYGSARRTRER